MTLHAHSFLTHKVQWCCPWALKRFVQLKVQFYTFQWCHEESLLLNHGSETMEGSWNWLKKDEEKSDESRKTNLGNIYRPYALNYLRCDRLK